MTEYWVDGSNKDDLAYGYGCVVVKDNEVIEELYRGYSKNEYCKYRNVAGECYGAMRALQHAFDNGYTDITIYYDYMGIQKWAEQQWKANNILSQLYQQLMVEARQKLSITFVKVKAHTGVEFNELADKLAKRAVKEHIDNDKTI